MSTVREFEERVAEVSRALYGLKTQIRELGELRQARIQRTRWIATVIVLTWLIMAVLIVWTTAI